MKRNFLPPSGLALVPVLAPILMASVALAVSANTGMGQITGSPRISAYSAPGSIFPTDAGDGRMNSLYSDPTSYSVGDFVTVVVNLSSVATRSKNTTTAKTATVNDSLTSLVIPNNVAGNYAAQWGADQNFNGGGSQADNETLITTLQARIIEAYPNGTFRIEAHRNFQEGKEKTTLTMTGVIRRKDLSSTNTISSTQVAELEVKEDGAGDISREQRKGWLTTTYEFLNPF